MSQKAISFLLAGISGSSQRYRIEIHWSQIYRFVHCDSSRVFRGERLPHYVRVRFALFAARFSSFDLAEIWMRLFGSKCHIWQPWIFTRVFDGLVRCVFNNVLVMQRYSITCCNEIIGDRIGYQCYWVYFNCF